jgi:ketosteroid isomerase-like protein
MNHFLLARWEAVTFGLMVERTKTMEGKASNAETVQEIYEAFGHGDVTTILDKLDDAVEWETTVPVPEVPWLLARHGKTNIVGFFQSLAPLKITRFEPHMIFDGGDKVFVLI